MIGIPRLPRHRSSFVTALVLGLALVTSAEAGVTPPTFSKAFLPATIAPGGVSLLVFTINNGGTLVTDLAFVDVLPAGVTIADPTSFSTTCPGAALTAPAGGSTITYSGGSLGTASSCTATVNVTSGMAGTHSNLTGNLTSSQGNSGAAAADLTVATNRPAFSKTFVPDVIPAGGRSTLTFLIDNTLNASLTFNLLFNDSLPIGMVVASPSNASTTCTGANFSAVAGGSAVSFTASILSGGATCTASVDVIGSSLGTLVNTTSELLSSIGGPQVSSGRATDALEVQGGVVSMTKDFIDDPAVPGGTTTLRFTIDNRDRDFDATSIAFTDDLDATLSGLVATGLPLANVCGPGSLLSGTSVLSLTGGNLAADGGSCSFDVTLQVPAGAGPGGYPNTTSPLTASLGGSPFVGLAAAETLFVSQGPSLTKTFLTNPVGAGSTATVEFTLTNNSATSPATAITFRDNLDAFLSGALSVMLPASGFCGAGSSAAVFAIGTTTYLQVSGANLPAGGSCTFSVGFSIPEGTAGGNYRNTTENLSATVDGVTQTGAPASDTLVVAGAPLLSKQFIGDPVLPGGTITLEFSLSNAESAAGPATGIAFTDDLTAALAGLTAIGLPANDVCGAGSVISGTTNLSFSGGQLAPGESCTFSVTLQVPAGATAGTYTNTTSNIMATVGGVAATTHGASDSFLVAGLSLAKTFTDDPVIAGGTVTLQFSLVNSSSTDGATAISFTDNLTATLSGLAATGLPLNDVCGVGSQISGTTNLSFTGGNLAAGASCTFSVTLQVPAGAADGTYLNRTGPLSATLGGTPVVLPVAADNLTVSSTLLVLTKTFTDDPVAPGGTVTLEFTLTNLDAGQSATALTFTDDLEAALSGLAALGLPVNDVCGAGSQWTGTSLLTLTGGSLPPGGSCTFSTTLAVPAGASGGTSATNTTSAVTGTVGGLAVNGAPASDDLQIDSLTFSKSFDGPSLPGGAPVLTFVLQNQSATTAVADLSFLDDLGAVLPGLVAAGLPQSDVCGPGSSISGTSVLTLSGGSLLPGGSCSILVTLQVPPGAAAGTYTNTTSDLFQAGLSATAPAIADLVVLDLPPTFAKSFAPGVVSIGGGSTLTFTIDNTGSGVAATALDFTDNLPTGLVVANPANASTTCSGGTFTAAPGSGVVSYGGGTVAAFATCSLQVDVVTTTAGDLLNTTGDLTSSTGNSGTASALLRVLENVVFTKDFLTAPVLPGGLVQLEYTITNPSATATLVGMTFTDDLEAVIPGLVAVGLPATDVCGTGSLVAGTSLVIFSAGTLAPSATCTFAVTVQVPAGSPLGTFPSTSGLLIFSLQPVPRGLPLVAGPAVADLDVAFLSFSKTFETGPFQPGDVFSLTFTIANPDPANAVTGIGFTDDLDAALPGLAAFGLPAMDVCGAGSQVDGTTLLTFTGGSLAPGASCTFDVTLQMPQDVASGTYTNVTSALTALVNGLGVDGGAASVAMADLEALAPVLVIPTLNQWGVLVLIGLFAAAAVRRLGVR